MCGGIGAWRAETVHVDLHCGAQLADEEVHVNAGAAVDVGRELLR
jgi:hypothetical protein